MSDVNPSGQAMASLGVGVQIGRKLDGPTQPKLAIDSMQDRLVAERTYARQLRKNAGYVASAAQPTYGFMAFENVVQGRIWEVLYISIWGVDPFSTTQQTQTDVTATNYSQVAGPFGVSIPAVAGQTSYVTGFEINGAGATAAGAVVPNLTGTISGTMNYPLMIPAGVGVPITPLVVEFPRPIPASAPNTAITLNIPSFGAGNVLASGAIHGYQQAAAGSLQGQAMGYISSYVPQDSNVEPAFPNLVLPAASLPITTAPSRRQVLIWPTERLVICFKGLANGAQLQGSISVIEYELSSFIKALAP